MNGNPEDHKRLLSDGLEKAIINYIADFDCCSFVRETPHNKYCNILADVGCGWQSPDYFDVEGLESNRKYRKCGL